MRIILCIAFALSSIANLTAQPPLQQAATDAYLITRMADKFHLQPKPIDQAFSVSVFDRILNTLDAERIFFTQEDIARLSFYRTSIDREVLGQKTAFLKLLSEMYEKRLRQADTMVENICRGPFDFTVAEKLTVSEDSSFAANTSAARVKLKKLFKQSVLEALVDDVMENKQSSPPLQKKRTDSLEVVFRKKVQSSFKRSIKRELETPGGIARAVGESYCEVIATYYDPHTSYFSLTAKENFDSELGEKSMMFGFSLDENDAGNVIITRLKPGSPAYQSGQLNEGDRILSIQWEGKSAIDVSDAGLSEVSQIISASNHEKATFIVEKVDGTRRQVQLMKTKMEDESDAERVKSFILAGPKKVGYISLPGFYEDWENEGDANVNGCANDVAREILKLKKENIDALVLDLRYNGGGSVREAVELAGIFIDAGPVAMEKDRNAKVYTLKDGNRGTMYDGPLFIMVNGFSASASELLAGTLQDYNRAVIIGSTTYGKATSQAVLPMDTTITLDKDFSNRRSSSYIKLTLDKLYRVTGKTAQFAGVTPDVLIPDIGEAYPQRESTELFAIPATGIEGNRFFKPLPPLNLTGLQQAANQFADTAGYFRSLRRYVAEKQRASIKKDISLQWKDALQAKQSAAESETPSFQDNKARVFAVQNHSFEQQRLLGNAAQKEINDNWRSFLEKDPYLQTTFNVIIQFIK